MSRKTKLFVIIKRYKVNYLPYKMILLVANKHSNI